MPLPKLSPHQSRQAARTHTSVVYAPTRRRAAVSGTASVSTPRLTRPVGMQRGWAQQAAGTSQPW